MALDTLIPLVTVLAVFIVPLAVLGVAALRFGVDSRPGIGDRDQRPWLVPAARG